MASVTVSVPLTAEIKNKLVLSWNPVQIGMAAGFIVLLIYLLCSFFYGWGAKNSAPQYVAPVVVTPPVQPAPIVVQPTPVAPTPTTPTPAAPAASTTPAPPSAPAAGPAQSPPATNAPATGASKAPAPPTATPNCHKPPAGWAAIYPDQCGYKKP